MTLQDEIMVDLAISPTTAHSLAARLNQHIDVVTAQLVRMGKDRMIMQREICDGRLIVWQPIRAKKGAAE